MLERRNKRVVAWNGSMLRCTMTSNLRCVGFHDYEVSGLSGKFDNNGLR